MKNIDHKEKFKFHENLVSFFELGDKYDIYAKIKAVFDIKNKNGLTPI